MRCTDEEKWHIDVATAVSSREEADRCAKVCLSTGQIRAKELMLRPFR